MKYVYEVQAYYSGWYTDAFFSSKEKADRYVKRQLDMYKVRPQAGRMSFRVVKQEVL